MKETVKGKHNPEEDLKNVQLINFPSIIVKAEEEKRSDGGDIILPQSSDEEEEKIFDVVKASEKCYKVKAGDRILLRDNTKPIATISRNHNKYMVFEELSVVMIINSDARDSHQ